MHALEKRLLIQPADRHRLFLMIPLFFTLGMGEVLGISSATSIFTVRYGVDKLPLMYVLEAVGLLLVSAVIAEMSGKMERPRFLRGTYSIMAGLILLNGLTLLYSKLASLTLWSVYYPVLLVSSMVIFFQLTPLFWLIAVDICSTQQAKRLFPILEGANTLGCITAGILGKLMAPLGVEIIYGLWALVLLTGAGFLFKTIRYYIAPLQRPGEEAPPNLKESIRGIYRSPFLLATLGILTLVMTLYFLMDYQFNTMARMAYNDEAQLAGFLALFLAVSNVVAVVIQLGFLSRIMKALGVSNITLLVTGGLGFCLLLVILPASGFFALAAVFVSYLTTRIMVNVIGAPSYQLSFKVVPAQERDGIRFLVEAMVALGGMLGGAALAALHSGGLISMRTASTAGLLVALTAFYMAWKNRAYYLRELMKSIGNGVQELRDDSASLLGNLVPPGFLNQLFSLLHHPDERKRKLVLEIAEQLNPQTLEPWIDDLLRDSCADVRSGALKYCSGLANDKYQPDLVMACCHDDAPEVRAAALNLLPSLQVGTEKLYEALTDPEPLVVGQAIITICRSETPIDFDQVRSAVECCLEGGPGSAAVICQAIGEAGLHEFAPRLRELLYAAPGLRAAACEALGRLQCVEAVPQIISIYAQADREFHKIADRAFNNMGQEAIPVLLAELKNWRDLRSWLAIIKALADMQQGDKLNEALVDSCLQQLDNLVVFRRLPGMLEQSGLEALAELAGKRCQEIYALQMEACWSVMSSIYDPFIIARVKAASQEADVELRETSLEVLAEGLADRRLARAMLELLDRQDKLKLTFNTDTINVYIKEAQTWGDYWLSEIARAALLHLEGGDGMEELETLSLLDKVILLKDLDLFASLQLEELNLLARVARVEIYPENAELMREGTPNSRLFVIIKGNIELGSHYGGGVNATIGILGPGEALGDTTVFDESISPVTAEVILDEAALLTIDGPDIQRLCSLYPDIAAGFIKAISTRVRKLERMLIKMA
ncbi:MAG: HEAT repeat domain-containing protein [Syntrophomonas sp.]